MELQRGLRKIQLEARRFALPIIISASIVFLLACGFLDKVGSDGLKKIENGQSPIGLDTPRATVNPNSYAATLTAAPTSTRKP